MEGVEDRLLQGKCSQRAFLCPAACREFALDLSKTAPFSVFRIPSADAEAQAEAPPLPENS